MGYILAMVGLGLMVGGSGAGSAIGLRISGAALLGAVKKRPELFGVLLVPFGMPATQGLYGFVAFIIYNTKAIVHPEMSLFSGAVILGAGLAMALSCGISAVEQGRVCANGIAAIGSGHEVFGQTIILGAFPEFYAILSLVAAILMKAIL